MLKKWLNNNTFVVSILILMIVALYSNNLHNEMFWDDDEFILKNAYIKDWQYWPRFFTENLLAGSHQVSNYWRPLLLTVFSVGWHLWQEQVLGWHLLSIGGHITVTVVLFFVLNRLFQRRTLSFLCCLFFAIHPAHTEIINYANSLGDQLASFFMLMSLWCWLKLRVQTTSSRWQHPLHYVALVNYILALMSKETAIMLPGLIMISEFIVGNTSHQFHQRLLNALRQMAPAMIIALIYLILRGTILDFKSSFNFYAEANVLTENISVRFFTFWKAMQIYTGIIFAPYHLQVERIIAVPLHPWYPDVIFGAGVFFSMLIAAIANWKKNPYITFGISWFFITILPMSNIIVPINALVYEHFLYIPMIGILIVVVWSGLTLHKHWPKLKPWLIVLTVCYGLFFMGRTIWRNQDWHTAVDFYAQLVQHSPTYRVLNNYGMELAEQGQHQHAISIYRQAIKNKPQREEAYHNLAGTLRDLGQRDQAKQLFQQSITLNPRFIFSYRALVKMLIEDKEYTQARQLFEQAIKYNLTPLEHYMMLAQIAERQRDWPAVYQYIQAGLRIDPHHAFLQEAAAKMHRLNLVPTP